MRYFLIVMTLFILVGCQPQPTQVIREEKVIIQQPHHPRPKVEIIEIRPTPPPPPRPVPPPPPIRVKPELEIHIGH
jgi:hypothetical protein